MKRYNKLAICGMIFLLIAQALAPVGGVFANEEETIQNQQADEELSTNEDNVIQGSSNIAPVKLTNVTMYYLDQDGQTEVDVESSDAKKRLSLGENVKFSYEWDLPNGHGAIEGDTFEFYLPADFTVFNDIGPEPLVSNGGAVGTFIVTKDDNKVTMTFNQTIEELSNIGGSIMVWSVIREELTGIVTDREINFPLVGSGKIIPISLVPRGGSTISKSGTPNAHYNGTELYWTVDLNTKLDVIKNAVVTDEIQEGQSLVLDSIELYQLDVDLDGNVTEGNLVTGEFTESDGKLLVTLGDIDSAYRLKYTTQITTEWEGNKVFNNQAMITGEGVEQTAKASISVSRGEMLNKRNLDYNSTTQTVTWEIQYNYSGKKLSQNEAVFKDFFSTASELDLVLDLDSFVVTKVTLDANGEESAEVPVDPSNYTVLPEVDSEGNDVGFSFKFTNDIDQPYKIVYQTKAKGRVFEGTTVTNSVEADHVEKRAQQWIAQQILNKRHSNVNYADKTIVWHITLNGDQFPMKQVVIRDIFANEGLTLLPDTLTVTGNVDYSVDISSGNGFVLTFNEEIKDTYTVSYKTTFDHAAKADADLGFVNRATLEWVDTEDLEHSKSVTNTFNPDSYTWQNGFKYGSYNAKTKEITWSISVNYNLNEINQATIEDYLEQGQQLVPGSLKIHHLELTGEANGINVGDEVLENTYSIDESIVDSQGNPGFKIELGTINTAYWVTYKTTLDATLIDEHYSNTATLYNGEQVITRLIASVSIQHGTEYTYKKGNQNGLKIDWTIWINRGQSLVPAGGKILDTPSQNQIVLEETIRIYGTTVDEDGNVMKDSSNELVLNEDYSLQFKKNADEQSVFEIVFVDSFDSAYVLEYQTFINAKHGDSVDNTVTFEGQGIATEKMESKDSFQVRLSGGSGTGSGEFGSLIVTKVDANDGSKKLEGATFSLYFKSSGKLIRTLTTGADGQVTFENLLYTDYILKEDSAPEGYALNINNAQEVKITPSEPTEITIKNVRKNTGGGGGGSSPNPPTHTVDPGSDQSGEPKESEKKPTEKPTETEKPTTNEEEEQIEIDTGLPLDTLDSEPSTEEDEHEAGNQKKTENPVSKVGGDAPSTPSQGTLPQTGESAPFAQWIGFLLCIFVILNRLVNKVKNQSIGAN